MLSRVFGGLVIAIAFWTVSALAGPFTVNYQLNGVTFQDNGSTSGDLSIIFDTANPNNPISQLLAVDITTTPGTLLGGTHYTNSLNAGTGTAGPTLQFGTASPFLSVDFLSLPGPNPGEVLFLEFDASTTVTPTSALQLIGTNQIPGEFNNGLTRAITAGRLVPVSVPEPATIAIFVVGLGLLGLLLRRRTKSIARRA